jgi:hypothetical protein
MWIERHKDHNNNWHPRTNYQISHQHRYKHKKFSILISHYNRYVETCPNAA